MLGEELEAVCCTSGKVRICLKATGQSICSCHSNAEINAACSGYYAGRSINNSIALDTDLTEELGKLVRSTWVNWAKSLPLAKQSWLTPWEELDDQQKEIDRLLGKTVWEAALASSNEAYIKFRCRNHPALP